MSAPPGQAVPEATAGAGLALSPESLPAASLLRRLAAMMYDSLLLLALLMIVTACFLPFTGGEAVRWQSFPLLTLLYWCVLAGAVLVYFGLPWTARGQTLAMTTWRLRVQRDDGCLLDLARRRCATVGEPAVLAARGTGLHLGPVQPRPARLARCAVRHAGRRAAEASAPGEATLGELHQASDPGLPPNRGKADTRFGGSPGSLARYAAPGRVVRQTERLARRR